jgi:hypothetical protein
MIFSRRRWLVVALALGAIAIVELVVDTILDPVLAFQASTLIVVVTIVIVGIAGTAIAFRSIDRLAATLRGRDAELERSDASARAL